MKSWIKNVKAVIDGKADSLGSLIKQRLVETNAAISFLYGKLSDELVFVVMNTFKINAWSRYKLVSSSSFRRLIDRKPAISKCVLTANRLISKSHIVSNLNNRSKAGRLRLNSRIC